MKKIKKNKSVMFVCTNGGHLAQILEMNKLFEKYDYLLVTEKDSSTKDLKKKYNTQFVNPSGAGKDFSFWIGFLHNFILAYKLIKRYAPDVIITTGAHTAIPFCYIGKMFGVKIIYVLSYAKIYTRSKAASIIYPITDLFVVQWPGVKKYYKKARYFEGGLY